VILSFLLDGDHLRPLRIRRLRLEFFFFGFSSANL